MGHPAMKMERLDLPAMDREEAPARSRAGIAVPVSICAATLAWLAMVHADTFAAMVHTWFNSQTFAHGILIAPVTAWLIWRRRAVLRTVTMAPDVLALPVIALAGCAWLLGELAGAAIVREYAVVAMIVALVWATLGRQAIRAMAFPLAFLFLAVPFGESLLPPLMNYTANFTVAMLRLTGVPVYRDGLFFTVPSGNWSVVEACSGFRYLIASATGGVLYAYLRYRSLRRRAVFVAASIVVPVLANGVRAYMIVMIDYIAGKQYALDIDHLLYGWVFFGAVTLSLFWIGSYWREDDHDVTRVAPRDAGRRRGESSAVTTVIVSVAALAIISFSSALAARLANGVTTSAIQLRAPEAAGPWHVVEQRYTDWSPGNAGAAAVLQKSYAANGEWAAVYVGFYRDQRRNGELITTRNVLLHTENDDWRIARTQNRSFKSRDTSIPVVEAVVQGRGKRLTVWQTYWVDGEYTASAYRVKWLQAKSLLLGRGDAAAVLMFYTSAAAPDAVLDDFASSLLAYVDGTLRHAR